MAYQFTEEEAKILRAAGLVVLQIDDHHPETLEQIDTTFVIVTENTYNLEEPYQINLIMTLFEIENLNVPMTDHLLRYVEQWRLETEKDKLTNEKDAT